MLSKAIRPNNKTLSAAMVRNTKLLHISLDNSNPRVFSYFREEHSEPTQDTLPESLTPSIRAPMPTVLLELTQLSHSR